MIYYQCPECRKESSQDEWNEAIRKGWPAADEEDLLYYPEATEHPDCYALCPICDETIKADETKRSERADISKEDLIKLIKESDNRILLYAVPYLEGKPFRKEGKNLLYLEKIQKSSHPILKAIVEVLGGTS